MDHKLKRKWESSNQIYHKDYACNGISWCQTNVMYNFSNNEFGNAQAIGGHMNVHRRYGASLLSSSQYLHQTPIPNPNTNLNPNFASPPSSLFCLPQNTFHASRVPLPSPSSTSNVNGGNYRFDKHNLYDGSPLCQRNCICCFLKEFTYAKAAPWQLNTDRSHRARLGLPSPCDQPPSPNLNPFTNDGQTRDWKKRLCLSKVERDIPNDAKVEVQLDLELRLGRSKVKT